MFNNVVMWMLLTVPLIFDVIGRQCLLNVCSDKPYKSFDVSSYFRKKTNNGTFIETVNGHYQPCINGIKSFVVSSYFRKKPIMELS